MADARPVWVNPRSPRGLARAMVADGTLTPEQAHQTVTATDGRFAADADFPQVAAQLGRPDPAAPAADTPAGA